MISSASFSMTRRTHFILVSIHGNFSNLCFIISSVDQFAIFFPGSPDNTQEIKVVFERSIPSHTAARVRRQAVASQHTKVKGLTARQDCDGILLQWNKLFIPFRYTIYMAQLFALGQLIERQEEIRYVKDIHPSHARKNIRTVKLNQS